MSNDLKLSELVETLQNIELSDIDFNNFGSWPFPVKIILCVLLFCLTLAVGYTLHLTDLERQLTQLQDQEPSLKQQYTAKAFQAAHLEAYREQLKVLEVDFDNLLHQLPRETEVPGLLEDITKNGLGSGLEFEDIKLQPEARQQVYTELPIQISVLGDFHALATFTANVTSMPRIVTLHNFDLKPGVDSKSGNTLPSNDTRLRLNVLAKTYRYNDAEGKK